MVSSFMIMQKGKTQTNFKYLIEGKMAHQQ